METGGVDVWRLFNAAAVLIGASALVAGVLDLYLHPRKDLFGAPPPPEDESNGSVASNGFPKP